jgi:hypothetical protein
MYTFINYTYGTLPSDTVYTVPIRGIDGFTFQVFVDPVSGNGATDTASYNFASLTQVTS